MNPWKWNFNFGMGKSASFYSDLTYAMLHSLRTCFWPNDMHISPFCFVCMLWHSGAPFFLTDSNVTFLIASSCYPLPLPPNSHGMGCSLSMHPTAVIISGFWKLSILILELLQWVLFTSHVNLQQIFIKKEEKTKNKKTQPWLQLFQGLDGHEAAFEQLYKEWHASSTFQAWGSSVSGLKSHVLESATVTACRKFCSHGVLYKGIRRDFSLFHAIAILHLIFASVLYQPGFFFFLFPSVHRTTTFVHRAILVLFGFIWLLIEECYWCDA